MPDKKLTDSEIKKALECISGKAKDWDCDKCAFDGAICTSFVAEKALDLINRLQAENERLNWSISTTLKEFADRVKMDFYYEFDELIPSIMADKIDNLLKEMVGADNE